MECVLSMAMLRFYVTVDIEADGYRNKTEKRLFMENAENVIQQGLNKLNLPDWNVRVHEVEKVGDD